MRSPVPLLLVKLWTVYPALFEWPPAGSVSRVISRLSILVLVGACAMQLLTGPATPSEPTVLAAWSALAIPKSTSFGRPRSSIEISLSRR